MYQLTVATVTHPIASPLLQSRGQIQYMRHREPNYTIKAYTDLPFLFNIMAADDLAT